MTDPFLLLFVITVTSMTFALAALWADGHKHSAASSILIATAVIPWSLLMLSEVLFLTPVYLRSGIGPFHTSLKFVVEVAATFLPPPAIIYALAPEIRGGNVRMGLAS